MKRNPPTSCIFCLFSGAAVDSVDKMGCTALHIAALYGHDLLSNTLLNYGADASKPGFKGYCNKKSLLSKSSINL